MALESISLNLLLQTESLATLSNYYSTYFPHKVIKQAYYYDSLQLSFDGFPHYNPLLYATELEERFGIKFDSLPACSSITKYMLPRTYDIYGSSRLGTMQASSNRKDGANLYSRKLGGKGYEITDHLGNIHAVISDRKLWPQDTTMDGFQAEVISRSDYWPFGSVMPGRSFNSTEYRFGFQGQEKDDEIKSSGNSINYKYRMHDPRLGRFLSLDPLAPDYPHNSPYAFSENRVIDGVELEGLEYATFHIKVHNGTVTEITVTKDYELKNKNSQGPGILYKTTYTDDKGQSATYDHFVENSYGIYQGSKNPQLPNVGGHRADVHDDYSLDPIDETDANAKQHDIDYDNAAPGGLKGPLGVMDARSTPANQDYIDRAANTIEKQKNGGNDDITGKPVTPEAAKAAEVGKAVFEGVEYLKNDVKVEKAKP